jgi:hypothetical protein
MGGKGLGILVLLLLLWGVWGQAELETTVTLPQGVYSPKLAFGVYTGLNERFNSSGLIEGVGNQYKINLTGKSLSRLDPKMKTLVDSLNAIPGKQKVGDSFSAPLTFSASPTVSYFVPQLAYGITPRLSVGFGIPIIHFQNTVQVTSQDNTAAVVRFSHGLSPEGDKDLSKLTAAAANVQGALNGILASRGYKPLQNEDYTAPGDLQISAIYRYFESANWHLAIRPYLQVPTGRQDDPDDLADIPTGGQPAIGLYSIHELYLFKHFSFISSVGYQLNIQDSVTVRVPIDSDDVLPDLSREETVSRRTGNTVFLEGGFSWRPVTSLEIRAVYDYSEKDADWYQGDHPDWNYGLLTTDTDVQVHSVKGLIEYSTVNNYLLKTFAVPFMVGYIYGNTIYAVNAPNELSHQLYLRMFF